jgi:hypothetical protein
LLTRKALDWTKRFPTIAAPLEALEVKAALLDGEIVAEDARGIPHFSDLANTAMTAFSELAAANFSAVVRLMKPKPFASSSIPTTTPPAPVHREGFTTSQLILIGAFLRFEGRNKRTRTDRAESEQNCSLQSAAFI